jgi:hypothetical protein
VTSFRKTVDGEVRFSISPDSSCPCGSRVPASSCCLTGSGFKKLPGPTSPPLPATGIALPACYAASLDDCSLKLSREHFVSESLLDELNRDNDLRVSGLKWQEAGQEKVLSPKALASKILCDRHNSALSSLDAIAARLFGAFNEERASGSGRQLLHLFSGHDLERWLLKILCGLVYSGNFQTGDRAEVPIPEEWLQILFGYADFPEGQGLYVCTVSGHRFEGPYGLRLQAIAGSTGLSGLGVWVCGYELILSMSGFPSRIFDGRTVAYRPLELYTIGQEFEKSIILSWQGMADLGTLSLDISRT